jgi:hypothetical protein
MLAHSLVHEELDPLSTYERYTKKMWSGRTFYARLHFTYNIKNSLVFLFTEMIRMRGELSNGTSHLSKLITVTYKQITCHVFIVHKNENQQNCA